MYDKVIDYLVSKGYDSDDLRGIGLGRGANFVKILIEGN